MNNEESPNDVSPPKPTPSQERFIRLPTGQVDEILADGELESVDVSEPAVPNPRKTQVKDYSLTMAKAAAGVAIDNNGTDVLVLDVCDQTALFDYFVIATGTSRRQLHAISEEIDDKLQKDLGDRRLGIEGYEDSRWIVLDYGNVVVHLFDEETRSYYDLESLWADATNIPLSDLGLSESGTSPRTDN